MSLVINNFIQWFSSGITAGDFIYSVENGVLFDGDDEDWEVAFLTSGTLTLAQDLENVDIFMINAGSYGSSGSDGDSSGGRGGFGGRYYTFETSSEQPIIIPAGTYEITVGISASGVSQTKFGSLFAVPSDAPRKNGGRNAAGGQTGNYAALSGEPGEYAFGDANNRIYPGRRYGASGGGGGESGTYVSSYHAGAAGGDTGGGHGGSSATVSATAGQANTGAGGGGGFGVFGTGYPGGAGGSGIILIRPSRS